MGIVVPTIKDRIKSSRLEHLLHSVVNYEHAGLILELIGHHIIGNSTALFLNETVYIYGAVSVVPVLTKITEIIRGYCQQSEHLIEGYILIGISEQGYRAADQSRGNGCS